jgi:hypothetical protein
MVLRSTGNFSRRTPTRELHVVFKMPCVYDFTAQLVRQQARVVQNHETANFGNIGQDETMHRKYRRLTLGGSQAYDRSHVGAVVIKENGIRYCLLCKA